MTPIDLDRELLEAWRETPDPELAARLRRVAALAHEIAPSLMAWDHPATVHRTFALPSIRVRDRFDLAKRQLDTRGPDPRIGTWLRAQLESGRLSPAVSAMVERLLEVHDPAAVSLPPSRRAWLAHVDRALDTLERDERVQLGRHVLARPDDLEALAVLADRLCEQGDPRGEFLQLQLAHEDGRADAQTRATEALLLSRHARAWFADVACVLDSYASSCRLGRLHRMGIFGDPDAPMAQVVAGPSFASVREVFVHGLADPILPFLPSKIEATWGLPGKLWELLDAPRGAWRPRRLGIGEPIGAADLWAYLRDFDTLDVLALEAHGLEALVHLPAPGPNIGTLCIGRADRPLEELQAWGVEHATVLDALGVREIRIGAHGLAAWEQPEHVGRR